MMNNVVFANLNRLLQLRVQLCPMKRHKRRHNFIATPSDWGDCQCAPEDTEHHIYITIYSFHST